MASATSAPRRAEVGTSHALEGDVCVPATFALQKDAAFIAERAALFERLLEKQNSVVREESPIEIELPNGSVKSGVAHRTTPLDIACEIDKVSARKRFLVAEVQYRGEVGSASDVVAADAEEESDDEEVSGCCGASEREEPWQLWDMRRPLEGSCKLKLLTFDDEKAKHVLWHSSAHILGQAMENEFGCLLTVGPALSPGFYYDGFMGDRSLSPADCTRLEKAAEKIVKEGQTFTRLLCSKEEALELFKENPFKVALINAKIPDGAKTTVYRCGSFVDLCRGPHLPTTALAKAFTVTRTSSAYWLGKASNASLQRVYGVSFPEKSQLEEYKKLLEEAKKRDHRLLGNSLNLFFFDTNVSPGSAFWLPEGAIVYNKLMDLLRSEYKVRGFSEVITPNIFSCDLWKTSGHYQNYKDNMFLFGVEGSEWGIKPMNCPGHCLIFKHMNPSYRQLPIRLADFGVLHRNEISGSLTGLTRVRRFQQDDAHIFCRFDQIEEEVLGALSFLFYIYELFGFECSLCLSTRPKKALGSIETWRAAEEALANALNKIQKPWTLNPGDGAFYGPKIDIQLWDALKRPYQCGTIQLDFQLPLRFNLQYRTDATPVAGQTEAEEKSIGPDAETPLKPGMARPVIIHRAILGSIERMCAVLIEHTAGKLPFWLSPRQCVVLPISDRFNDYAAEVTNALRLEGYHVALDDSNNTIKRKIRDAQIQLWNYMLVVGEKEASERTITVRDRADPDHQECLSLEALLEKLRLQQMPKSYKPVDPKTWKREA